MFYKDWIRLLYGSFVTYQLAVYGFDDWLLTSWWSTENAVTAFLVDIYVSKGVSDSLDGKIMVILCFKSYSKLCLVSS